MQWVYERDGFSILIRFSSLSDALGREIKQRRSNFRFLTIRCVNLDVSLRFSGGADVLFENCVGRDCVQMTYLWEIRSYTEIENLNSKSFGCLFSPSAKSGGKFRAKSEVGMHRIRPGLWYEMRVCRRERRLSKDTRLNSAELIFYTDSRESAWKKSPGDAERAKLFPSLFLSFFLDISGGALFKDISLLFKARRCKNTCHHMRVVHTKAHTIGRYWYMGISMRVTNAKSAPALKAGVVRM